MTVRVARLFEDPDDPLMVSPKRLYPSDIRYRKMRGLTGQLSVGFGERVVMVAKRALCLGLSRVAPLRA